MFLFIDEQPWKDDEDYLEADNDGRDVDEFTSYPQAGFSILSIVRASQLSTHNVCPGQEIPLHKSRVELIKEQQQLSCRYKRTTDIGRLQSKDHSVNQQRDRSFSVSVLSCN